MKKIDKRALKMQAHALKPVVIIGQLGLTEAVIAEIEIALNYHELIKIKIRAERAERLQITQAICDTTHAHLIQSIGQIIALYRFNPLKNKPS